MLTYADVCSRTLLTYADVCVGNRRQGRAAARAGKLQEDVALLSRHGALGAPASGMLCYVKARCFRYASGMLCSIKIRYKTIKALLRHYMYIERLRAPWSAWGTCSRYAMLYMCIVP
jgi:hypothetical protein